MPRFERQRQDLRSPTASNTAFMAAFFMNSGITFKIKAFSLLTLAAIRVPMSFAVQSSPMR